MEFKTIAPGQLPTAEFHSFLLGAVSPRPIAFASTIDALGNVNLSPFSFFNVFGSNPPIMIFSPARRVRDNTNKHTLENVLEVKEVVINIVDYNMVEQASLASCEYEKGVNEFVKAGFTPIASVKIKPPRVAESPASFECKVNQIIETGSEGGAGNLIICEVLLAHFRTDILDENGKIDPRKVDTVARMGGDWYCRASGAAMFEVPKPNTKRGIGYDQIPLQIRESNILTANNLGRLGNIEAIPTFLEAEEFKKSKNLLLYSEPQMHEFAKQMLEQGHLKDAWMALL